MSIVFEARLALRYTLGHKRSRLGNFITSVSALGLILGVAMLITVLSVMNGFDKEMRERILVLIPHIKLLQSDEASRLTWEEDALTVASHPNVISVSPYSELDVLYRYRGRVEPGLLYGIEPSEEILKPDEGLLGLLGAEVRKKMNNVPGVVLGSGLAESLGIEVGDQLTTMVYQGGRQSLKATSYEVLTLFHSGTELDQRLSLVSFDALNRIPGQSSEPQGLRVQVESLFEARFIGRELQNALPLGYRATSWERTHGNLYEAIQMSRYLVSLIVVLILAIAAFNLVATLMIASADKQSEIAILKTLGATPASAAKIFALQGLLIGLIGSLIGGVIGVFLSLELTAFSQFLESALQIKLLNTEVYPLDYLPSYLHWGQVAFVIFVAVALSVLAAVYPAWKVSKVQAAQVLRYE